MQHELKANTVEWWLNQIQDPIIKRLALGNMCINTKMIVCGIDEAIDFMFMWDETKEGTSFWCKISESNDINITFESVKHLLPENYVL